jgi:hypothetical protein
MHRFDTRCCWKIESARLARAVEGDAAMVSVLILEGPSQQQTLYTTVSGIMGRCVMTEYS